MADYSHMNGGYNPYAKSKVEPTYNGWEWSPTAKHYPYESHSPPTRAKPDYSGEHRDHVCKPVIVDAHGRKRPIVSYGPTPNHYMPGIVTETETIVEQVHVPLVGHMKDHETYKNGSNGWNKPNGNTMHDPYFGGYQGKSQSQEPTVITSGGWVRPSPLGWATPPLTKPTNDIGAAIDYLKDAATMKHTPVHSSPPKPWLTVPVPSVPTINSSEARRRYANFSESPRTVKTTEIYSAAIDSREAVRRYGGQLM